MNNGKILTDFNDLHIQEGLDAVARTVQAAKPVLSVLTVPSNGVSENLEWPEPVALPNILPPVKPFGPAMLPLPFQEWVMDIADRMQCPPDFCAAAAVAAVGIIVGRACGIYPKRYDDWMEFPNLWGMVIGRPSLLKSPSIAEAFKPLMKLASDASKFYRQQLDMHEHRKAVAKAEREIYHSVLKKALKAGKDMDMLISEMPHVAEPIQKRFVTQDGTTEKIGELLVDNPRGILNSRDELSGWMRNLDKIGREGDRAFYLESWNAKGAFTFDRIGRGTIEIPALCLSVFGAITPGPLSEYMFATLKSGVGDDGLMQRFQISVYPDSSNGWKNVDRFPDTPARQRAFSIFERLSGNDLFPPPVDGNPPALRFDEAAQNLFNEWRFTFENRLQSGVFCPPLESHFSKYRKLVPTLALVFHLINVADGTAAGPVSVMSLQQALAWSEYLESHAKRIYSTAQSPEMETARQLMKHIKDGDIKDGASIREIHRYQWHHLDNSEMVKSGFSVLEDYGWVRTEKVKTGGRPSEVVKLHKFLIANSSG